MGMFPLRSGRLTLAVAALLSSTFALAAPAYGSGPGSSSARPLITQKISNGSLATLAHNVRPELNSKTDLGVVEDTMELPRMYLVLQHTPEQQADLRTLIEHQHQQGAPEFHKWLTPEQFGERFGASQQDIATLTDWLESQGFTVTGVLHNNSMIAFKGTAANVRESFHTQLHYIDVNGTGVEGRHYANAQDPQIPSALAPIVAGITGLQNIPLKPDHTKVSSASFDASAHKWHNNHPEATSTLNPNYTDGQGDYYIAPQDYYTIYNVNPVFTAGDTAGTATVAVVEQSDMAYGTVTSNKATGGDVSTFRSVFGVSGTLNMYVYHGYGTVTCTDPGVVEGDETEATLDAEWASALAPNAKLVYMSCGSGVIESLTALVDNNLADAMSMSYGHTEIGYTSGDFSELDTIYSQAATQGQSIFVSTGDSGSDVADQNTSGVASSGINVSALSASPYVTATGGTDFQDEYDSLEGGAALSKYWNANTSTAPYGSALQYIPEMSWNDNCASSIFAAYEQLAPAALCDNSNAYDAGFVAGDIVGGSGGFSTHYAVPSYQSGITGYSGTMRAQPDISMFASNGFWYHALLFCDSDQSDPANPYDTVCDNTADFGVAGGTSFVAPAVAGIAGLLVDYTGTRQGVLNYGLYALAKTQFTASATKTACYSNGQTANTGVTTGTPASSCIFNDVTTGTNDEACASGGTNCYVLSGDEYGILSTTGASSLTVAYPSTIGYDEVSGIGTLNVYNLLTKWNTAFTSSTSLSASPTTITSSQSTTLTATVTGSTPSGFTGKAPTVNGTVTFYSGTTSVGTCTLASGTCNTSVSGATLGSGSHSITATFSSQAYATSTSTAQTVTVTSSTATTTTTVTATPSSATYGQSVSLKATVAASSGTATGTVTFTTGSTSLGTCTLSSGTCTLATTALPFGSDTVTAAYGGATGFGTSSGTVGVTVSAASTSTTVTATPTSAAFGASVTLKATVTSSGGTPTGLVTFKTGSTSLGSCTLASGTCSASTTALPVGSETVTATYAGATDFTASSGTASVSVSTAASTTTVTATPTSGSYGASITLKATTSSTAGTPTGTITFTNGSTSLGTCTLASGTCSVSTTALPVGTDTVTASYGGATDFATSSGTVSVTISKVTTTISVAATPNPATIGQNVSLKATVTAASGTATGGTVSFAVGTTALGTCTLASGTCTLTANTNGQEALTYPVVATYAGSTDYAGSTSPATNVVLNKAPTTTTVAVTPSPIPAGATATITATVKRPSGSSGTPTGTVTFYSGTTLIGSANLNGSGVATYAAATTGLGAGSYPVTANYAGDASDNSSSGSTTATLQ